MNSLSKYQSPQNEGVIVFSVLLKICIFQELVDKFYETNILDMALLYTPPRNEF